MALEVWQQFGLVGMVVGALFYTVYRLGQFAVTQWTENVGQAMCQMANAVKESSEKQTRSFRRYERRNRELTKVLIQLVCTITGKQEPIDLSSLDGEDLEDEG